MKVIMGRNGSIRVGLIKHIVRIDVKAGEMTFGQRIELGKIAVSEDDETVKIARMVECLHGFRPGKMQIIKLREYITEIMGGLLFWTETENSLLKYEPTPEEKRAGIVELVKKIGELGTIKALAKAYHTDPDTVLGWKYSKVFGILYTDLEESKYQRKYSEIIKKKK